MNVEIAIISITDSCLSSQNSYSNVVDSIFWELVFQLNHMTEPVGRFQHRVFFIAKQVITISRIAEG